MRKIFTLGSLLLLSTTLTHAQTGSISGSIGTGYFIQGVSPVNNIITVSGAPAGTQEVEFYATDPTYSTIYDSYLDNNGGNGWSWTTDMGQLPPGAVIWTAYYDASSNLLDYSPDLLLDIIAQPTWLSSATLSNVIVAGNYILMDASYPINSLYQTVPSSIKGIGNRSFSINNSSLDFLVDFDMITRNSTVSGVDAKVTLNTLGQDVAVNAISFSSGVFNLDQDFNLSVLLQDSISTPEYSCNFPGVKFPLTPLVSIKVDAGVSFYATLKGQIVIGQDPATQQWGFIDNGSDQTKIIAKAVGTGFVRTGISVLGGLGSASGTLTVTGRLGAGFEYVSVPTSQLNPLFGGDINVGGKVQIKTLWGMGPGYTYHAPNLYSAGFGNYSAINKVNASFENIFGTSSITYQMNATLMLPDNYPQPSFGTRDNQLYAVWIENNNNTGYLLFSKLDTNGTAFSPNILVESNSNSISNPKVAIMPSGSALITWSQNRYDASTVPAGAEADTLMYAQDIWGAIYDESLDAIVEVFRMDDDTTSAMSGRAEGEANVTMGAGSEGLITWVSKDPATATGDIYYSVISENASNWTLTMPDKIADLPGINKGVNVAYTDSLNALAVWINDPDGADTTLNSEIVYSAWDGSSWTTPAALTSNQGDESYDELSMDYNDGFCALAWTSTIFDGFGGFTKRLDVEVWDDVAQQWDPNSSGYDEDSMYYFQKPRVSVSNTGIASVAYQVIELYPDTNAIDPGEIYLFLKDMYSTNFWQPLQGNNFLCDTSTYIWELDAGFGGSNRFYTLTQEYNETTGVVTNPNNGILFGDPDLSMVLRGMVVNSNLTVSDINEPGNIPTGYIKNNAVKYNFNLQQNFPNPFNTSTTISYRIMEDADVKLEVYDMVGRLITTLVNQHMPPGNYQTDFEAGNLQSGIYFCKLTIGKNSMTKKMILTR